jgi:2-oxoglutarate ferredoxin oxidoreductase subunit gamma
MKKEYIFAGFGGQGMLLIGKFLAMACMMDGKHVSWLPSYGPEMRGGTANCSFSFPSELIAMNAPSLEKFEPVVKAGGLIFVNSSVVSAKVERSDLKAVYVPCAEIAYKVGNPKVGNMVMLGAYVGATGVLKPDTIREMIREMFTGPKAKLQELNFRALDEGMACVC